MGLRNFCVQHVFRENSLLSGSLSGKHTNPVEINLAENSKPVKIGGKDFSRIHF
jgi:hypothetical protein